MFVTEINNLVLGIEIKKQPNNLKGGPLWPDRDDYAVIDRSRATVCITKHYMEAHNQHKHGSAA